jgi:hypothetical protein
MIFQCRCSHNEAIFPEQVHITLADLPNSMLVQWVTMKPINKTPFVKYGHREDNLDLKNMASVEVFNFNNVLRYMYTAEMTNLDYNSTYCEYFRIKLIWNIFFRLQCRSRTLDESRV